MLPKEEYISLLANLFQRGLCLDMIDIDGKQDSPDISDEERISFKAADEALSRVDLDELFDNAEILEIPDKYPEFYEYLRELQLERQEDGHGERTIEDVSADEEVEEGEEEPGPEEPQGLSTKDRVLKNIVDGEHTGNQRDSEKYRKGDEMRARLDEERREALSRAAEQERYDNEHRMSLESKLEDERGEAIARAEEQQRQREALRQKELAERPETTVNITSIHDKSKSADGVTNVVKGNIPDESTKHNESKTQYYEPDTFNEEREIHDRQESAHESNTSILTSHEGLNPRSASGYEREARTINKPSDLYQQMQTKDNDTLSDAQDRSHKYDKRDERPEPEKKDNNRSATNEYSSRITNDYAEKDSHITEDINRTGPQVFEPKRENVEQISGHEELNTKSAQDVSHVVKGDTYSDFFEQDRPEVRDERNRADVHNESRCQSSRGIREGSVGAGILDRKKAEDTAQYHSEAGSEAAVDNTRRTESENKYISDSYEKSGQRDTGETYKRHQYDEGYGGTDKENRLYEAENSHTNRNTERVGPNQGSEYNEGFIYKKDAGINKHTESEGSIVEKRREHDTEDYRSTQGFDKPNSSEPYKASSIPQHEKESVYDGNAISNPDSGNASNGTAQYKREASESKKYINDSYEQAGQRESADIQSHKGTGEDTYASFKPKTYDSVNLRSPSPDVDGVSSSTYTSGDLQTDGQPKVNRGFPSIDDATKNEDQSSSFVARNERRTYDATANSTDSIARKENGDSHSVLNSGADKRPSAEPASENAKRYVGSSYEMAGQKEAERKDRGYENLERQGLVDKPTGSVQPPFSDGIGEVEKKYEKSSTREISASEVTSRRQSAVDDLSKSERFQADNIVRRPISQMPDSHTASNQYPGLDGDSHQPSEAKAMVYDRQQDVGNHRDEKPGASVVEEVLRNRAANQENQDADRPSGGITERKQTYSRDSYESSGQAPVDEKRKEPYGQGETYSYVGRKDGQADRKVAENRVLKSDKTDVVYPQKRSSSVASESKNGLQSIKKKDETKVIEIPVPSGSGQTHTVRGAVAGAAAVTAVAAALAAREAAKATSDAAKTATDKAEGMVMLKDTSIMSASELAAYASAVNSAQAATQISGKQIADSYALAGQADAETIKMNVEQALANAREIAAGTRSGLNVPGAISGPVGPASSGATQNFNITRPSIHTLGIPGVVKNSNFTDVGMFVLKEGNQVTISRNGKSKRYTVRSDGTIRIDGIVLNVYSVDKDRAFVGWKNAAVYGGKIYTATGTVLDISTDGSIGTTKTLAGLEFHIKRDVKVNARQMTMAMTIAPALNQPITDADFVKVGDKFISNKVTESYSGLLYQKALNKGKVSQLIFKQKMAMHSVFRAQLLAGAAANMKSIDLKLDLNTLVANYDKILTSISGNSKQFYQMNVFLETRYLSDIERQYLFDAKAKLKHLGLTENTDTLKELLAGGGLSPEAASAITDYLNVYENTREKIIRKGVLGDQSVGDFKVERAFYAAALPYVLQARGLPSDKKALKKLLKAGTTSKETKELIRNVFKLQRRMFLLNLTETTLTAYAKGAVKAVKNGYRKIKSLANRYMGDDYTMRGLLMMESIIVGSAMKAYRTSRKIKWMRENAGRLLNSSIRLGKSIGNAAVAGYRGAKAGIHAVHMGGRAARKGFQYLRKNGLKKTLKKGVKKLRMKGTKVVRKGVLKVAKVAQKAAIKAIQAAIKLIQTLISALVAALGPIIIALIIVLAIILCIISYVKNAGNEVYYDAGDEDTTEVLQEMVDVLTLCHNSFRSELSNHFGGTSSTGSASGTDGSTMNAPQLQKGDSSKVQGLYDVTEGTWWNYEFTYQYIHGNWASGTRQQALDNKVTVEGNGNYAVVDQNGTKMYMAAFGSYWGKVGDVLKVEFNNEFTIGSQPASNTMYIIIADEKAWKDTGYPAEQEGIYGHHLGSHRDFAEFIGYGSKPAGLNGNGLIPTTATNMGSILDGTFDSSTIGTGAAASSVSVNADILYRQEIDQDVYRDILNRDKNIYYTFPEEQKVPDGITPTPTPEGYVKADAKGEVYGFYNNNQELISMVMAMFDFEASSSTSTKSTIISKKDASGFDEAKTNDTYQKGMTDKEVDDKWKLIEYLNEKGLDLTNYKAGGYDDLRYSALIGLFNASHIITGTAVKQYHAGPDGTINPVYNDDGRIVGQNNTDGMSYQVPVMETKTRQVRNEHGDIQIEYYTGYKTDSDGNIVYETKYAPCPGHTKYSGAVITLHFDSLLNLDDWWEKNIYGVDDFDKENPNYESSDASADTYRAKENTLKRTIQYIKKPDYYKSLSGTCSEGENSTTDSFNPGTWDGDQAKVAKEVYEFLTTKMSRKLTSEQAMGVLVNIYRECSFNYTEEETGGTGYGLTQWSFGRRTKLVQWCNANGYQYNTLEGQLKRLECEFTEDTSDWSPSGVEGFYACTTAREAGEFFITNYERPGAQYKAQRLAEMDSDIATIQAMLQS
ncbi:phage tail tip lysozyme [Blautia sp. BCRC 81119]|uniref:phage tail tip lysozyme n=1 Tax=Blautia sp. BCRC 81119 TaxID=2212480 RepID=UPI0011B21F57|nr:phage tail tip lysozyme [Blautia sp. BCRC 81119]